MDVVLQNVRDGRLSVQKVPDPIVRPGCLLIANRFSLISAGTEKSVMNLAQKSLLGKARERPDHVRRVLEKVRNEGLWQTVSQVRNKLDEPISMGYSSAGVVLACGAGVQDFKPGDEVASNGSHASVVCVPRHLCAHVPSGVKPEHASFAVVGSIALQGIRLAHLGLGDKVLVIGLGLIGQIAVQLLRAHGCQVLGMDPDPEKCRMAVQLGAQHAAPSLKSSDVLDRTHGLGADAVLVTASTSSSAPVELAGEAVRKKGRVVLVGAVGMDVPRRPFYFKEAELVVSCSYGPGRYDPDYEDRGIDYPAAYVRWTEQRNLSALLELMSLGNLDVSPLISHQFPIERAEEAYRMIGEGSEPYLGILIRYPEEHSSETVIRHPQPKPKSEGHIGTAMIGSGSFARAVLMPAIQSSNLLHPVVACSAGGVSAHQSGNRNGFARSTSSEDEVLKDKDVDAVFIATRHDLHSNLTQRALAAGKHVFVEKPLAIDEEGLETISLAVGQSDRILMVGFNRRFSPSARQIKSHFEEVSGPLTVQIRFNAGSIPAEHWTQNESEGGGRLIGEACHAIDLATYLTGSPVTRVFAESVGGGGQITDDQCIMTFRHANGSISSILYVSSGDKAFPKERVEVFGGGRVGVIEDFREVLLCSGGKHKKNRLGSQDKGHKAGVQAFAEGIRKGSWPIPWTELRATTLASILAVRSLREGVPFEILE